MIARLRGILVEKGLMEAVIECHGVGYLVIAPKSTLDQFPGLGTEVTALTVYVQREDSVSLFGFATIAERDCFNLLVNVSGIGGRTAISILSAISVSGLQAAIISSNLPVLQRIPGVGKKTAERLVVELKDKITTVDAGRLPDGLPAGAEAFRNEAISAMTALGFTRLVAEQSVKRALDDEPQASVELIIRKALQYARS